jgi:thiamine-phosphate pyrophosphorylase
VSLYLPTPRLGNDALARSKPLLAEALGTDAIACVLLRFEAGTSDATIRGAAEALRPLVQDRGAALLIEDRADIAAAADLDGVHLNDPHGYVEARRLLGAARIVGVACDNRHDAMLVSEKDADYVAFGSFDDAGATEAARDLVEWWSTLMTVPCVAATDGSAASCHDWITTGADFLALGPAFWLHPAGPAAALAEITAAIATASGR